jgi:hypothetical protein
LRCLLDGRPLAGRPFICDRFLNSYQSSGAAIDYELKAKGTMMTMERVRAALMKLKGRGSVGKVLELMKVRTNPALAVDPDYQRAFKGYYRMGHKRDAFYRHFFSMLREAASAPSPPSLKTILQGLYENTDERHLSFGTKMLATIADDAVIFDKNVAAHFDVRTPLPRQDWLFEALRQYEQIRRGIQAFTQAPEWQQMQALFDQTFPDAARLSEIRKADLIIWAAYQP